VRIELHCHSTWSDGSLPAAEVAALARDRGVELFCLTDHDSCAGYGTTREIFGDRAVRGVELSCHDNGRTVHVLVYDTGGDWEIIDAALASQARARRQRLSQMAARLEQLGAPIDVDAILATAGGRSVGRPDLARALVDAGHVRSNQEAFHRFLRDGGPADVPVRRLSVADGLELGRRAGARMALAHPDTLGSRALPLIREHRDAGLDGVEAIYGAYPPRDRDRWLRIADQLDLVVTAGSDFHGEMMPMIPAPGIELDDARYRRLLAWLGR
jgi:predicted metal-dependent phosphoesterase TrpH